MPFRQAWKHVKFIKGRYSPLGAGMAFFPATPQGAPLHDPLRVHGHGRWPFHRHVPWGRYSPTHFRVSSAGNGLFTGTLPFTPLNAGLEVFVRNQRRVFKSQQENQVEINTVEVIVKKTR